MMKIEKKLDYIGTLDVGGVVKGMFDIEIKLKCGRIGFYYLENEIIQSPFNYNIDFSYNNDPNYCVYRFIVKRKK